MFPAAARWPARHSSADEAVPRIPCTTRCPGSTRHRANSNCRRWTPARSMPSCQGCPTGMRRWRRGCLRRLRGIPAVARRNHHHRRGRARSGGGHLYAAPRVLRAPARRFPRRGWGECAAVRACRPARRILDGDGDARAGRHGHRRRLAPSGADHAGRRVAPARAIQRDGLPGLRLGGRHAQGAAACVVASGCLCARTAIPLGRGQRRRDGVPIRRRDARQPRRAGLWRPGNRACGPAAGNREGRRHARIPGRLGPSGRYQRLGRRSHIHRRLDRSILDQPGPVEIRRARRRYLPAQRSCCELPKSC